MLSSGIGTLWVEGEVSNFACPASGHWYFSLKDERAQCRAAMFKGRNSRIPFTPQNGQKILIRAQVTLYEARGEFQLVVDHLEDAGIGELMRRYEQLKAQLGKEGLFDAGNKKQLPEYPKKIGLITSATGAAIRDVLSVIERRAPHIPVILYPTAVQGETAAAQIREALRRAKQHNQCDVILLIRGGGSLEDMWCFNDEALARDLADFPIPVVTGIGHEIDFTIADFVADFRAPTPSVAAESVTPDRYELMQAIDDRLARLYGQASLKLQQSDNQLKLLTQRLQHQHPRQKYQQFRLRLNHARDALSERIHAVLYQAKYRQGLTQQSLRQNNPKQRIAQYRQRLGYLQHNQLNNIQRTLTAAKHQLAMQAKSLDTLSPLKTLSRGFATVSKGEKLVTSVKQLNRGDQVSLRLSDGSKDAEIK